MSFGRSMIVPAPLVDSGNLRQAVGRRNPSFRVLGNLARRGSRISIMLGAEVGATPNLSSGS